MRIEQIAVIGSGIAGMRAARLLSEAGHSVTVFEKGRGTGGRMASGALGETSADLGAAMIEARTVEFEHWLHQQGAERWQPRCASFGLDRIPDRHGWVAVPRSSAMTRALAEGIKLCTDTRVAVVWPDRQGVLLRDTAGASLGYFDAAVIATPAPQAATLLDALHRFRHRAEQTPVSPSWVVQLALPSRPERLADIDWLEGDHPMIRRIVRDSSKPKREGENWVIQANESWSRAHVNADPARIAGEMLAAFAEIAEEALNPLHRRVHGWLYARAEPLSGQESALWDRQNCIGACGDWLCGGDLEGAWMSANELVARILASRSKVA